MNEIFTDQWWLWVWNTYSISLGMGLGLLKVVAIIVPSNKTNQIVDLLTSAFTKKTK